MPAKKGSIDKSFGRKALDGAKYIGKNFWKVLPIGSVINYSNKREKLLKENPNLRNNLRNVPLKEGVKQLFHMGYSMVGFYTLAFLSLNVLTKNTQEYDRIEKIKSQMESEHKNEVNYFYNRMFENAKTSEDSLEIYNRYNLPFKFLEPTLEQKERAIKQNALERSLR